jgi:predicted dehydrogenase
MSSNDSRVWLVGAGGMARDYARVLDAQRRTYIVFGRGEESAARFEASSQARVIRGGFASAAAAPAEYAIIAVGVEALADTAATALERGVRCLLVEKPAGLDLRSIEALATLAARRGAQVYVAYNRRFYASVLAARRLIAEDGGVSSFTFEFTEWSHEIQDLHKAPGVKESWVLANSSHVIDLAFHLGGEPRELHALHGGSLGWHPAGAVFAGCGSTASGALFSYHANWQSAGRWGVEVNTARRRLILRPMEQLQVMMKGSVAITAADLPEGAIDQHFKPGLYRQVEAFFAGDAGLCGIAEHVRLASRYAQIAGYTRSSS